MMPGGGQIVRISGATPVSLTQAERSAEINSKRIKVFFMTGIDWYI